MRVRLRGTVLRLAIRPVGPSGGEDRRCEDMYRSIPRDGSSTPQIHRDLPSALSASLPQSGTGLREKQGRAVE